MTPPHRPRLYFGGDRGALTKGAITCGNCGFALRLDEHFRVGTDTEGRLLVLHAVDCGGRHRE